ncbi:endonuclease domain-containing protein [Thermomicrobium sp. 4228-Ro]|uniref:endonuclease domain-containing protein n=1 Tax=Thermomicrobium sp. 4228-Ro TaxID=2993937 RepID=UPI002248D980|nr:endonuclease domain-containing protein [Thermomicrobium sp. 4228-Ro]MCX2726835.1 endonuclease domain-containing protein [Thermomicrobium sp. 4228-Ro]
MDERRSERSLQRRLLRRYQTRAEERLWAAIRGRQLDGWKFRRQHHIGPYVVDFVCLAARLVVEVDGPVHAEQRDYDAARDAELTALGYRVLRLENVLVLEDLPRALAAIRQALADPPRSPNRP